MQYIWSDWVKQCDVAKSALVEVSAVGQDWLVWDTFTFSQATNALGQVCLARAEDLIEDMLEKAKSFPGVDYREWTVHLFVSDHITVWVNISKLSLLSIYLRYCHYIKYKATLLFLAWLCNFWNTGCCLRAYDTTCGTLNLHFQVRQPGSYFLTWTVQTYTLSAVLLLHRVGGERGILEGRK